MTSLVKQEPGALATQAQYDRLLSDDKVDAKDILIPKILLMQGLSDKVANEQALMGEMRDSLENTLLGGKASPVEIIPFHVSKTWILFEKQKEKFEYVAQVPWEPENSNWQWNAVVDGKEIRRDQALNVYCLLPSEIAAGIFMPYLVSFRRTSYKAGKKLQTVKEKLKMFKRPLASKTFLLKSVKQENDLGSFYVFDVEQSCDTTPAELDAVAPWFDMIQSTQVRVDDSDLSRETEDTNTAANGVSF